tara:strand:+ start:80 stop:247 length:168 start_codon:yes stop_codon:yes gene_type:complete
LFTVITKANHTAVILLIAVRARPVKHEEENGTPAIFLAAFLLEFRFPVVAEFASN